MSGEVTLILGGARSGKSDYAEKLAAAMARRVLYVATAQAGDAEMAARIMAHRQARPEAWATLEAPRHVGPAIAAVQPPPELLLLDCMTLLVSNILLELETEAQAVIEQAVRHEIAAVLAVQRQLEVPLIVVSNEVGLGLVPAYPLGRIYRDVLGRANQQLAAEAGRVLLLVAGIPMTVKDNI